MTWPVQDASVVLADPPWSYDNYREAVHGAAASAYRTMSLEDVAAIPVGEMCVKDAVLALWITGPALAEGRHTVLFDAWGFTPKTMVPWLKNSPSTQDLATGVGIWFMANAEYVVFAVRKNPGGFQERRGKLGVLVGDRDSPEFWKRVAERAVLAPKSTKHSRKPDTLHEYLETFGEGPRVELFATQERAGWTCLGRSLGWELGPWGARNDGLGSAGSDSPSDGAGRVGGEAGVSGGAQGEGGGEAAP